MRHIHLDAVGGIAGDMFVAALVDAFPVLRERVETDARAVLPDGVGAARFGETASGGIAALCFGLDGGSRGERGHRHDHGDDGSFRGMAARIRAAGLSEGTGRQAVAILTLLAEAEAAIHRTALEDVHFHEIADWDSLLDVVAAGSIAAALAGARWSVSPLPLGGGLVRTQHGLLPVPAPATARLVEGFAWRDDGVGGERVTPTGAAILKHLVDPAEPARPEGVLRASGTGAGTRRMPGLPNILRALAFETQADAATLETVTVLAFEIDDMTGEEVAVAAENLRRLDGVLDLSLGQRQGKKHRMMQAFRLLVRPSSVEAVAARCFAETSTIGLRLREERRIVLPRRAAQGPNGVPVKISERPDGMTAKAESDALEGGGLSARRQMQAAAEAGVLP